MSDSALCTAYRANERQGMMMLGTVITTETPARIEALCGADGATSLCAVYTDETFASAASTCWYARALLPPTPRWHTHDCARLPAEQRPEVCSNGSYPDAVNEMAWTSPNWYRGN